MFAVVEKVLISGLLLALSVVKANHTEQFVWSLL